MISFESRIFTGNHKMVRWRCDRCKEKGIWLNPDPPERPLNDALKHLNDKHSGDNGTDPADHL